MGNQWLCYVDTARRLCLQDAEQQQLLLAWCLATESPAALAAAPGPDSLRPVSTWLFDPEDRRYQLSTAQRQGLLLWPQGSALIPADPAATELAWTQHYICPDKRCDLHVCIQSGLLAVFDHASGKLWLFSLDRPRCLGSVQLREPGLRQALHLAFHPRENSLYLSHENSPTLQVLLLSSLQLNSFKLPWGDLGALHFSPGGEELYLQLLSDTRGTQWVLVDMLRLTLLSWLGDSEMAPGWNATATGPHSLIQRVPDQPWLIALEGPASARPMALLLNQQEGSLEQAETLPAAAAPCCNLSVRYRVTRRQQVAAQGRQEAPEPAVQTGAQRQSLSTDTLTLLRRIVLLAEASETCLQHVARQLQRQSVRAGETLMREGEAGSCLYFVSSGRFRVHRQQGKDSQTVATLQSGDVVGEMALVHAEPRSASVTALEDGQVLRLDRLAFLKVSEKYPELSKRLNILAYERQYLLRKRETARQQQVLDKVQARMALRQLRKLTLLHKAPEALFEKLAQKVRTRAFLAHKNVFSQGESAECLYFICLGTVSIQRHGETLARLGEGELFGEMAWLLQQPRNASAVTETYCKLLELDYTDFAEALQDDPAVAKALQRLVSERQQSLEAQESLWAEPVSPAQHPLPGLALQALAADVPRHSLYYLSPLEEQVFRIQDAETVWASGTSAAVRLFQPRRLQFYPRPDNCLLIADTGHDRMLALALPDGHVQQSWGAPALPLCQPRAACLAAGGQILIADTGNQRLVLSDARQRLLWEHREQVLAPEHVSLTPEGTVLYSDSSLHQVREINFKGELLWAYGTTLIAGDAEGELNAPAFAWRRPNGLTLIADTGNQRLLWVGANQRLQAIWQGSADCPLVDPMHCEWDAEGRLYVHSGTAENISCFSPAGQLLWQATLLPA